MLETALLVGGKFASHIKGFALRPAIGNVVTVDPVNGLTVVASQYVPVAAAYFTSFSVYAELRILKGHNGPVFDIAFDPTGRWLASASGDRTVKLWDVASGERLDTFSQPTKDQYAVAFLPDGHHVIAGGVDSRIREWRISPTAKEGSNPQILSLFAHDGPIVRLVVSRDGRWIVSSSEDRTIKIWEGGHFLQAEKLADQPDWVTALAISPDSKTVVAGGLDGRLSTHSLGDLASVATTAPEELDYAALPPAVTDKTALKEVSEVEPNDTPKKATEVRIPGKIKGVLTLNPDGHPDVDLFRFHAKAGQTWILETEAAQRSRPPTLGSTSCMRMALP